MLQKDNDPKHGHKLYIVNYTTLSADKNPIDNVLFVQ